MDDDASSRILALFHDIDRSTSALVQATGLCCPPGCGDCCRSPHVDATELELLPLAHSLLDSGEAEALLELLQGPNAPPHCVFFTPTTLSHGQGRCVIYPLRPMLCRCFGFSAVRDKHGRPELAACAALRRQAPEAVAKAAALLRGGFEVVVISEACTRAASLDPDLGGVRLPIHQALVAVLQRVGLMRSLAARRSEEEPAPDPPRSAGPELQTPHPRAA